MLQIQERVQLLLAAKQAYYTGAKTLLSDEEFDRKEEELRQWDPQNPYFEMVGSPAEQNRGKIRHTLPMLSMDKVKQAEGVSTWFEHLAKHLSKNGPKNSQKNSLNQESLLCIQPKIDGISASCYYHNGQLQYIATRGDGQFGQDISHVAKYIPQIPKEIDFNSEHFEVRGELYIPKDTKLQTNGKPLRNICSGLVNRKAQNKKQKQDDLQYINFVAYQCPQDRLDNSEYQQLEKLAKLGFQTIAAKLCTIKEVAPYAQHYLKKLRSAWNYETDGLIICIDDSRLFEAIDALWVVHHHHHYAVALKPPAESGTSILQNISWQVGRQGRLSPVAQFLPVRLTSAVIERASLHNYANVCALKLQRGDILEVERSGDVIPYVRRNLGPPQKLLAESGNSSLRCTQEPIDLERACIMAAELGNETMLPQVCPSCAGELEQEGKDLLCPNRKCPEQAIQRILFWIQQAEMDQIAEQSIRQLYDLGKLKNLQDLYKLSEQDFASMPSYADKKIHNFVYQLQKSRRMNVLELIERLGIPTVQQKNLSKIGGLRRKSRWDQLIKLVAQDLASDKQAEQAKSDEQHKQLLASICCHLAKVLPEWQGSSHLAEQLLKKLLQEYIFEQAALLLEAWGKKSGQAELWKNAFPIWEELLLSQRPNFLELLSVEDFIHFREPESRYSVINALSAWLRENQSLLQELLPALQIVDAQATASGTSRVSKSSGKTICMTGNGPLPRKQLQEKLEAAGYTVVTQMTKNTDILLAADLGGKSSKLKKATAWGVTPISYEEFLKDLL